MKNIKIRSKISEGLFNETLMNFISVSGDQTKKIQNQTITSIAD